MHHDSPRLLVSIDHEAPFVAAVDKGLVMVVVEWFRKSSRKGNGCGNIEVSGFELPSRTHLHWRRIRVTGRSVVQLSIPKTVQPDPLPRELNTPPLRGTHRMGMLGLSVNGVHVAETSLKAGYGIATVFAESISSKAVSYRLGLSRILDETQESVYQRELSISDTVQMECTVS